jgi:hypothetical protein
MVVLPLALALAPASSCRKLNVVTIDLQGGFVPSQIKSVRVRVHQVVGGTSDAGGYAYDNTSEPNDYFRRNTTVSLYLPVDVKRYAVVIDAFDDQDCLSGAGAFDVGDIHPVVDLAVNADGLCGSPVDRTDAQAPDAHSPDAAVADREAIPDAAPDTSDAAADEAVAECGSDTHVTTVSCFDPTVADAGAAKPFDETSPNPECEDYCRTMIAACPDTFTDLPGCRAVCTEAGWHLPADGSGGQTDLSCLAAQAHTAFDAPTANARMLSCLEATPSSVTCISRCQTYCLLSEHLCKDSSLAPASCMADCSALDAERQTFVPCLIQLLAHDVPGDPRFCSGTTLDNACGRCSTP